jgi:hypothetical protein
MASPIRDKELLMPRKPRYFLLDHKNKMLRNVSNGSSIPFSENHDKAVARAAELKEDFDVDVEIKIFGTIAEAEMAVNSDYNEDYSVAFLKVINKY